MKTKVLAVLFVFVILASFASCGTNVEGTYKEVDGNGTLVLKEDEVVVTYNGLAIKGTYEVDGKEIKMILYLGSLGLSYSGTIEKDTITIQSDSGFTEPMILVKEK